MSKINSPARTSAFAHLLAGAAALGGRMASHRAEEPSDDKKDEEDEARKARRAEEDEKRQEEDARRAEEDARRAEEDGGDPKDKKDDTGASGKKAEDNEGDESAECPEDDDEMAKARREGWNARGVRDRRIFSSEAAGIRPDMAAHLAFEQEMPSAEAIAMLEMAAGGAAPRASRLATRMARVVVPNPGTGGSGGKTELSFGEMAAAAAKKAGII
jgi:hypothetical protein